MKKIRCNYKHDLQQLNAWEEFKHEIKGKHENNRLDNTVKKILGRAKANKTPSDTMLSGAFVWSLSRKGDEYWQNIYDILFDKYNPKNIQ